MAVVVGYPDRDAAQEIVRRQLLHHPIEDLQPVLAAEEALAHQRAVRTVHVDATIVDYVVMVVQATRAHTEVALGASPRSMLALTRTSQARAVAEGRTFVLPDDVKALAPSVLGHRLLLRSHGGVWSGRGREVVREVLEQVPIPLGLGDRA
jgi:MoxR-like ATPase